MPCLVLGRKAHVFYEVRFFEKVVLSLVAFWILAKNRVNKNLAILPPILSEFCPNNKLVYLTSIPHLFSKIEPITSQKPYNSPQH